MAMFPKFQDALIALPTVIALDALLPDGIESTPDGVYDALRRDEMKEALAAAESWVEGADGDELAPHVGYALLLEGCDRLDDAIEAVDDARTRVGAGPELDAVEAELRLERGEFDRAEQLLDRTFGEDADQTEASVAPSIWAFVGDLFLDLEREEPAIRCYERALEGGVENFETAVRLAKLHEDREHWSRAAECFERAARLGGDVVGPWREAADCWRRAGRLRPSLEARTHVLDARGGDAEMWAKQGVGYRHLGELDRAAEALEKATRFGPDRPEYWLERAEVLEALGRPERAIDCYRKVLRHDPEFLSAHVGIASAALDQGDPARAEEAARAALEIDEAAPEAQRALGRALRVQNDTDGALEALRRAVEFADGEPDYHRELGEVLLERGATDTGLEHLERAVDSGGAGAGEAPRLADALLRAEEYDRLRELLESSDDPADVRWRLLRPVYRAVEAGISEDERRLERAADALARAVDEHGDAIPVDANFEEIERFATVLGSRYAEEIESMIQVLEGRRSRSAVG